MWALIVIILALVTASDVWNKIDARLAEAAKDSLGFDTPVNYHLMAKTVSLLFICTFGVVLTAYTLAYTSDELISYFGEYDDDTKTEGDQKTDASEVDPDGTSAQWDLGITHMITTFYAYFVYTAISYGGFIFFSTYGTLEDKVQCDFNVPDSQYDGVKDIISNIKDYDSCIANILDVFKKMDVNKNGYLERCEDAQFQHFMGSTVEYATKFSSEFSAASAEDICSYYK